MYGRTDGQTDGLTTGWTHDGHNAMKIARWPSASGAKNVIKRTFGELNNIFSGRVLQNCI